MRRIITILVVALLLTVIMPAVFGCAKPTPEAAEPSSEFETSGTMETIKQITDPNPKIENFTWTGRNTGYWNAHGGLEGIFEIDYIMEVDQLTGKFTTDGFGTFTGKVNGKSGSFVYQSAGTGYFTSMTGDAGVLTTEDTIIRGTGELVNLRGSSTSESKMVKDTATGTYSGKCRFEE